ncbi:hypothetical protein GMOD_00008894 [Pyrenophora seminiperda CCB06]|uniref:Uncharacterized protein n=1 Tax=Pyrenophora seminiperda CCB06 TaxID=1302712 RepID=A0A3M7M653_9PLEO|nr:hypothetical protein GMOD_00008894 [Pyrenophora seminiperda CCB06]
METLEFPGGSDVGPEDIEKIKGFIQEHALTKDGRPLISDTKWEDEKNFSGNFHCETLMLSLQLLHKTLAARDEISSDKNSTSSYLQLPPRSIVDSFAKPAKVLPVSKRCCPACHALMEFVNENTKEQIIYPGYHENWFTAALPPWLPRDAGMAVIKAAEIKLAKRVLAYVKSNTPLSVSSTGTSHITTFRDIPLGLEIPKSGIEYDSDSSSDRE